MSKTTVHKSDNFSGIFYTALNNAFSALSSTKPSFNAWQNLDTVTQAIENLVNSSQTGDRTQFPLIMSLYNARGSVDPSRWQNPKSHATWGRFSRAITDWYLLITPKFSKEFIELLGRTLPVLAPVVAVLSYPQLLQAVTAAIPTKRIENFRVFDAVRKLYVGLLKEGDWVSKSRHEVIASFWSAVMRFVDSRRKPSDEFNRTLHWVVNTDLVNPADPWDGIRYFTSRNCIHLQELYEDDREGWDELDNACYLEHLIPPTTELFNMWMTFIKAMQELEDRSYDEDNRFNEDEEVLNMLWTDVDLNAVDPDNAEQ